MGLNPRPALRLQEFPALAGQRLAAQAQPLHVDPAALAAHNHWLLASRRAHRQGLHAHRARGRPYPGGRHCRQPAPAKPRPAINAPAVAANTAQVTINRLRALIALPGETTADLARRAHQRLGEFLKHNELRPFDAAIAGRPYFLEHKRDAAAVPYHVLQPGETVFDVAQKYGMRQRAVYAKNRLRHHDELRPGRVLWLQHTRPRETAPEYRSLAESAGLERPSAPPVDYHQQHRRAARPRQRGRGRSACHRAGRWQREGENQGENRSRQNQARPHRRGRRLGEALATATATAATPAPPAPRAPAPVYAPAAKAPVAAAAPAPRPYTPAQPSAAKRTYLPAPAAAPAPAPLPDEPREADSTTAVPAAARPAAAAKSAPKAPAPTPAARQATHVVAPHESVYSIGRLYQLPPATLIALNQLEAPYGLTVGQVLLVQGPAPAAKALPTLSSPAVAAPAPAVGGATVPVPMRRCMCPARPLRRRPGPRRPPLRLPLRSTPW